ncbi:hypothetical protein H312_02508, partial [Anncaliia algerae PRA339]
MDTFTSRTMQARGNGLKELLINKSLFNSYLLGRDHGTMSSLANSKKLLQRIHEETKMTEYGMNHGKNRALTTSTDNKPVQKTRRIRLYIGTALEQEIELKELISIFDQDVLNWVNEFRVVLEEAKWTNDDAIKMIKILVSKELHFLFKDKTTIDTILDSIVKEKYPSTDTRYYLKSLAKTKQDDFILIKNYYNTIVNITS